MHDYISLSIADPFYNTFDNINHVTKTLSVLVFNFVEHSTMKVADKCRFS